MIFKDIVDYFWLAWLKESTIASIEDELEGALADNKTAITNAFSTASNAYQDALPKLTASLQNQAGNVYTMSESIGAGIDEDKWVPIIKITPTVGDANLLLNLKVTASCSTASSVFGYIGLLANTDTLASTTTLASMPHYSAVYGGGGSTPLADVTTWQDDSGTLKPQLMEINIPINARLSPNGFTAYVWDVGVAGCNFVSMSLTYRNESAYTNEA